MSHGRAGPLEVPENEMWGGHLPGSGLELVTPHGRGLQAHEDSARVPFPVVTGTFPESVPLVDNEALRETVSPPSVSDKRVCACFHGVPHRLDTAV